MPVLIESLSFVAPRQRLAASWPGGLEAFLAALPADRVSDDGVLVAYAIESPAEEERLRRELAESGLVAVGDREFVDVALVHQRGWPGLWCRWLEVARVESALGGPVMAARLGGDERAEVAVPADWSWLGSRSQRHGVGSLEPTDRPLRFVGTEPGAALYIDRFTGEEVRIKRPDPAVRAVHEGRDGARHEIDAEVVREGTACALGLMHRERLAPGTGMLFLFGRERWGHFWMKNTLVELDLLFVDKEGRVVELVERAAPLTLAPRGGRRLYRAVLEVPGGWIAAHEAQLGDRLRW